ncbi:MAG: penicillin-binding protein 1C [Myxococcales bacterium]|nr:penicillin-binding protein 1C [Myxococcales bacterium]
MVGMLYAVLGVGPLVAHGPSLAEQLAESRLLRDSAGEPMRLTLASDGIYRRWVPLSRISPRLVRAFLLYEDRAFFLHPGVDPVALTRAALTTYLTGGRRMGASTLTMQLARRLYRIDSSRLGGKLVQMARALQLELRYHKRELLEAYLNLVPMGGNIEGVGAAAMIYFGKPASALSLAEAVTLAVIPQNPQARRPRAGRAPRTLLRARTRLLAAWGRAFDASTTALQRAAIMPRISSRAALPFVAPHLSRDVLARTASRTVNTTIDSGLQQLLERRIADTLRAAKDRGLRNAAALLVDHRDMSVRALVGSADFFNKRIEGQVDGTAAYRSPGSTLKPFIYALALEQGLITPQTLLRDLPLRFGKQAPENFDRGFVGPIAAWRALVRSRNVPAVALAAQLAAKRDDGADGAGAAAAADLYGLLRRAGLARLGSRSHHGLGLALGGVDTSMRELAELYATLAAGGRLRRLRLTDAAPYERGKQLLSPEAAFVTLQMLGRNPRPEALRFTGRGTVGGSRVRAYYKTGTSQGNHDAWSVGVVGPYVLAVWLGNFNGESSPELVGARAAAPLFFAIADALVAERPAIAGWSPRRPPGVRHEVVCALSGHLPSPSCPHHIRTWFIPGRSPIARCAVHQRVRVSLRDGRRVCSRTRGIASKRVVVEAWSSQMLALFKRAGVPRRAPPAAGPTCLDDSYARGTAPTITSPRDGASYLASAPSTNARVALTAGVSGDARLVHWFVDERYVGRSVPSKPLFYLASIGRHVVRAVDDAGRVSARHLEVRPAQ